MIENMSLVTVEKADKESTAAADSVGETLQLVNDEATTLGRGVPGESSRFDDVPNSRDDGTARIVSASHNAVDN